MNSHASMMVSDALGSGGFGSRHHAPSDSRLLMNLIKAERTYCGHLHSSVMSAHGAASALSSWGTSETPDVADASARLADLLTAAADVQSTHVAAIEGYRSALKDVADREASIRTVVRDRDILVSRLIKASQKSGSSSKKSPEERAEKVAKAQRELAACEEALMHEEAALVGVKRRTFKEALTMRMKTMGDAGAAMVDAAKEAIMLLDEFDSSVDLPRSPIGYAADGFGGFHDPQYMGEQQGYGGEYDDPQMETMDDAHVYHDAGEGPYRQHDGYDDSARYTMDHPSFENASVTPSQSASQIYHPSARMRESWQTSVPGSGSAQEGRGLAGPNTTRAAPQEDDSDNDEDFRQAFNANNTTAHTGGAMHVPPPHQLGADAGTTTSFFSPQQPNGYTNGARAGPPLPDKDANARGTAASDASGPRKLKKKSSTRSKTSEARKSEPPRELNYVNMPPIPSAPRLDAGGVNIGPVPSAPKLYMAGASGDHSSSDEGHQQRARPAQSSWDTRATKRDDDRSSDGGRTLRQSYDSPSKKGFFGKMGRLFRASSSGPGEAESLRQQPKAGTSSAQWRTRTDANVKKGQKNKDPGSAARKSAVLTGPIVPAEDDSSDEEGLPDPRHLVRHVNKGPAMWQNNKASSDIGTSNKLLSQVPRPNALKRTPSASVTAGPQSFRAQQEAGSRPTSPPVVEPAPARATLSRSNTGSTMKKKKKKQPDSTPVPPVPSGTAGPGQTSVTVPGDASAGVRRTDSINRGAGAENSNSALAKRSSKRLSQMSTQPAHHDAPKAGAMRPVDASGKYATSSWIAKSNDVDEKKASADKQPEKAKAPAAQPTESASKPPVLAAPVAKPAQVPAQAPASRKDEDGPRHVPQPSRTMSPPLKPALKSGSTDLARSGSITSSLSGAGAFQIPTLPAPVAAPPRVSEYLASQSQPAPETQPAAKKAESALSIEEDKNVDGTGRLNITDFAQESQPKSTAQPRTALPRIDMPQSEPFRIDLNSSGGRGTTGQRDAKGSTDDSAVLMTPNEQNALATFMSQQGSQDDAQKKQQLNEGVSRSTVRRAAVGGGVLGPKNVPPPVVERAEEPKATEKPSLLQSVIPGKLSRSYSGERAALSSDSSDDEGQIGGMAAAAPAPSLPAPASAPQPASLAAPVSEQAHDHTPDGSTLSRRKSVRMAPDVKFPPETPPGDELKHHSKQSRHGVSSSHTHSGQLSSRIAPPPPAPGRMHVATAPSGPIDLGSSERERSSWTTRIGARAGDDSSSDEDGGGGGYAAARRSFGSASQGWASAVSGKAGSTTSKKKKRASSSKANSNSGYNPAVPLPVGMEVVGRSGSFRRK